MKKDNTSRPHARLERLMVALLLRKWTRKVMGVALQGRQTTTNRAGVGFPEMVTHRLLAWYHVISQIGMLK
jgi:hypothetical protein